MIGVGSKLGNLEARRPAAHTATRILPVVEALLLSDAI